MWRWRWSPAASTSSSTARSTRWLVVRRSTPRWRPRWFTRSLYVESVGLATFPDCAVICGPLQHHEPSPKATALNPTILVEVTSDSSEDYDTGPKLEYYRTIPTLREYVIVSHRERRIVVETRGDDGTWATRVGVKGERVEVSSLDTALIVDEIYRHSAVR